MWCWTSKKIDVASMLGSRVRVEKKKPGAGLLMIQEIHQVVLAGWLTDTPLWGYRAEAAN